MSQILPDIEKIEFPLERFPREIHGTDGRLELLLDAKTIDIDEPQEITKYFRNRLKEYGASLFPFILISHFIEKRLIKFEEIEEILKPCFFKPITFPKAHLYIKTIFPQPQLQTFIIDPEVKEILKTDEYSRKIIDNVLLEIQEIPELSDENYYIAVSFEQDIEVPEWKEILISVKVKKSDYDAKMRLWETIEEKVRAKIEQIRDKYPAKEREIIDRINENLAIEIEEIF